MIVDDTFSQLVNQSLGFVVPKEEEIDTLLASEDLYREYIIALGWMQDYLLDHSNLPFHRRVPKSESKTHIQEIISNDLMIPLVDNLVKNQAIVLRFSETAEESPNSESIKTLIDNFLSKMADFLNFLREAQKSGNKEHAFIRYRNQKSSELEEVVKEVELLHKKMMQQSWNSQLERLRNLSEEPDFPPPNG